MFCFGGKKPISSFFFPPPISFTQPPPPSESFVLGSVSCFCAVWFRFLGLSCSVVVFQTHCDLTASVPVPTTIWKGGRGPTAGMLGQKVTSQAQRLKGGQRQMVGDQSLGQVCGESSPICLTSLASPPLPRSGASALLDGLGGRGHKHIPVLCLSMRLLPTLPNNPRKQALKHS